MKTSVKIPFLERIPLKRAGRLDGKRGLIHEDGHSHWTSPFLDKELHHFQQISFIKWTAVGNGRNDLLSKLGNLAYSTRFTLTKLEKAQAALKEAEQHPLPDTRKPGEETLAKQQLENRRKAERRQLLAPQVRRIQELKKHFADQRDKCADLYSQLLEEHFRTRMECEQLTERTLQRISVYWNAALRRNRDLPAASGIELPPIAENLYMDRHKVLFEEIDMLLSCHPEKEESV